MRDMTPAVDRIRLALRRGETILVHGDYDVDGVCAAALYTRVLTALGGRAVPFVPHRLRDGYDLGTAGLAAARQAGAALILTADCGTVAHEAVASARAAGIDVVVTDHHTPAADLPSALAVVNPNRADCDYPEKTLCGTGVAFKLCQALVAAEGGDEEALLYHLDLVALATIADLVPLRGENRVMVRYGLRVLSESRKAGLRALIREAGLKTNDSLSAGNVGYGLAPRLNAAGRVGEADWALRLLLTDDETEAANLAAQLEEANERRRTVDHETLDQAVALLERDYEPDRDFGLVLAHEGWHAGVVGIVASRVVELVQRPTVLIALKQGAPSRGSARSVRGFDLYGAIHACGTHLERYGGHRQAAGLDIRPERIDAFRAAFNAESKRRLAGAPPIADIEWDMELSLGDATSTLLGALKHMAPFGAGNPTPVFVTRDVEPASARTVGSEHLKLELRRGSARLDAIGFGLAGRASITEALRGSVDVAFQLRENSWNGRVTLQARIIDLRVAGCESSPGAGAVGG